MSLLPNVLPLTELVALAVDMGVIGGVDSGRRGTAEFAAATLGTLLRVGVGLLAIIPAGVCAKDDWVAMDEAEFDLLGLLGRTVDTGATETAGPVATLLRTGAEAVVGVMTGEGWTEFETEIANEA